MGTVEWIFMFNDTLNKISMKSIKMYYIEF